MKILIFSTRWEGLHAPKAPWAFEIWALLRPPHGTSGSNTGIRYVFGKYFGAREVLLEFFTYKQRLTDFCVVIEAALILSKQFATIKRYT